MITSKQASELRSAEFQKVKDEILEKISAQIESAAKSGGNIVDISYSGEYSKDELLNSKPFFDNKYVDLIKEELERNGFKVSKSQYYDDRSCSRYYSLQISWW